MMVSDKKYQEHTVFSELDNYINFYKSLSSSVFGFSTIGTKAVCNIDSYVYSSTQGTLESIKQILKNGRINDAYSLLRKYYDSTIINIYSSLYLQDHSSINKFIVEKINDWLHGKETLPEYRIMSQYIKSSNKLKDINKCLYSDNKYKEIRKRCNDYTHYNFFHNVLLNDNELYIENRLHALHAISKDIRDIFILHLAYIFFLNDHYMMSSDYVDYLDCGMTPEPDSQYWVASFIQETFDNIISKERRDIADLIKSQTSMHLS